MIPHIRQRLIESAAVKQNMAHNEVLLTTMEKVAQAMITCFKNGGKVLFCGNGGSAADAQHLAAEFSGRFYYDRAPLYAEALHVNSSYMTAVANDYSYDEVYARMVRATGREGDMLVGISTSGNSANILRAFEEARERSMTVVAMTGETGGKMKSLCNYLLNVPSQDTPRIQEGHITLGHTLCELVEVGIFPNQNQ